MLQTEKAGTEVLTPQIIEHTFQFVKRFLSRPSTPLRLIRPMRGAREQTLPEVIRRQRAAAATKGRTHQKMCFVEGRIRGLNKTYFLLQFGWSRLRRGWSPGRAPCPCFARPALRLGLVRAARPLPAPPLRGGRGCARALLSAPPVALSRCSRRRPCECGGSS